MICFSRSLGVAIVILELTCVSGPAFAADAAEHDVLLSAMKKELARSFKSLQKAEKEPMHYLGYEVHDKSDYELTALLGGIRSEEARHKRFLTVDVRVGSRKLDNTHQIKGPSGWWEWQPWQRANLATEDEEGAIRADIWLATDKAYKSARKRYTKVKSNKAVTAEEEDKSDDFSKEAASRFYERARHPEIDKAAWQARLRRVSRTFKKHPFIIGSQVTLKVETLNRYMVNSEGNEIVTGNRYVRLYYFISGRTKDGMDLARFRTYDADRIEDLPGDKELVRDMERSAAELEALLAAPLVEPYTGPAIFRAKATGVFFHEILGHRLEGHRQKIEEEGQTFTAKLGRPITAGFISVYDDPTMRRWRDGRFLLGSYKYDDEGMPSQRVTLVKSGILKGFLMSRSPIKGFANSNGHGRRSAGRAVTARMGNTIVEAAKTVPYERLRKMLIEEVKKQKKPHGLIFEDIAGGFTVTERGSAQVFKVQPRLVYRIYADGRPDEVVRGADIVGTPLLSFTKIIAAADDYDIFNGYCGAASGMVPVASVAPSMLFSEIEVEKKYKRSEKPPALPPPFHDPKGGDK